MIENRLVMQRGTTRHRRPWLSTEFRTNAIFLVELIRGPIPARLTPASSRIHLFVPISKVAMNLRTACGRSRRFASSHVRHYVRTTRLSRRDLLYNLLHLWQSIGNIDFREKKSLSKDLMMRSKSACVLEIYLSKQTRSGLEATLG